MKKTIAILTSVVCAFSLCACGESQPAPAPEQPASSQPVSTPEANAPADSNKPEPTGKMTLYYAATTDWADPIIQEFSEKTGIEVELVNAGASELFSRIVAEKDNPLADALWGGSNDSYGTYRDLFEPYESTEKPFLFDTCITEGDYYYGLNVEPTVMMYNTKLLTPEEAPKSWLDLTDPKWKGKIALADPGKSGSAFGALAAMYQAYDDANGGGDEYLAKFVANLDGKLVNSSTSVYKYVADGEYEVGIGIEELVWQYKGNGADLDIIYQEEGIPLSPTGIGIVKNCKNLDSAQQFIDFMLGKEVQARMADMGRRPCRSDLPPSDVIPPIEELKILEKYDPTWSITHGQELTETFRELITQ